MPEPFVAAGEEKLFRSFVSTGKFSSLASRACFVCKHLWHGRFLRPSDVCTRSDIKHPESSVTTFFADSQKFSGIFTEFYGTPSGRAKQVNFPLDVLTIKWSSISWKHTGLCACGKHRLNINFKYWLNTWEKRKLISWFLQPPKCSLFVPFLAPPSVSASITNSLKILRAYSVHMLNEF